MRTLENSSYIKFSSLVTPPPTHYGFGQTWPTKAGAGGKPTAGGAGATASWSAQRSPGNDSAPGEEATEQYVRSEEGQRQRSVTFLLTQLLSNYDRRFKPTTPNGTQLYTYSHSLLARLLFAKSTVHVLCTSMFMCRRASARARQHVRDEYGAHLRDGHGMLLRPSSA